MKFLSEILMIRKAALLAGVAVALMASTTANMAWAAEYRVVIENHRFEPATIEMVAGEKHRLHVINNDATPEEFESYELNREKIIAGRSTAVIFLPALAAGSYPFFGEFNEETAQGLIVVK
ncbi:cupredoxin domain-containing protein [Mariprofundus sp. NF]|uniref:cupredoxin domain-containing protein n=1 Tax=Mariprofundus sp. NF TaxID=2608716 RepID=UPI0019D5AD8B|nr:cupredoxin domain-containing protein [Mariprofundus sp. NF]